MRLSEIKPDTLYATCDGVMVRAVEPISGKWYEIPVRDDNGNLKLDKYGRSSVTYEILAEAPKEDPWATCSTVRPNRRGNKSGMLVEVLRADEDGKPLKTVGKTLVRARDIGGTWDDFLLLHAERVRKAARDKAVQDAMPEQAEVLRKRLAGTGFQFPVGDIKRRSKYDVHFYNGPDSSKVHADVVLSYGRDEFAEGPPLPLAIPKVYVEARNQEDADYLLEVLRLGVTHKKALEKRRAREAAARARKLVTV